MSNDTLTVAKKEYAPPYPVRFEKDLYKAMVEDCEDVGRPISMYLRKLVEKDLQAKGKWPVT